MKKSNETKWNTIKTSKNVKNLNDLFNKYLYFLKIYSPYVSIEDNYTIKQKNEKEEEKEEKEEIIIQKVNNVGNKENNESYFEENSIFNIEKEFSILDLNLPNNLSSRFI